MILMPSGCQGPIGANAARVLEKVGPKKKQQLLFLWSGIWFWVIILSLLRHCVYTFHSMLLSADCSVQSQARWVSLFGSSVSTPGRSTAMFEKALAEFTEHWPQKPLLTLFWWRSQLLGCELQSDSGPHELVQKWILSCCSYFPNQIILQIEIYSFSWIVGKIRETPLFFLTMAFVTFRASSFAPHQHMAHTRCTASCWKSVFRWLRPIKCMPISCGCLLKLDCSEASGTIPRNQSLSGSLLWSAKSLASLLFRAAQSVSNIATGQKRKAKPEPRTRPVAHTIKSVRILLACWRTQSHMKHLGQCARTEPLRTCWFGLRVL